MSGLVCGMGWREQGLGVGGVEGSGGLWVLLGRCFDFLDFFGFLVAEVL